MPHEDERNMVIAIGGFADLWLYSGREHKQKPMARDFRRELVKRYPCQTCGAEIGKPCTRETLAGVVSRRLPHFGRGTKYRGEQKG